MSQVDLFPKQRVRFPQKTMRARVLDALRERPMTDEELCRHLRRPSNSVRPRRVELENAGEILCVDKRKNANGRTCKVWAPA